MYDAVCALQYTVQISILPHYSSTIVSTTNGHIQWSPAHRRAAASQALACPDGHCVVKALPPCVSHLTPSRRKAFVPKFLLLVISFLVGVAILRPEHLHDKCGALIFTKEIYDF
jgi:hypothetical protein